MTKKVLFITRSAPHGHAKPREALAAMLAASAFQETVSVLFMDDGVLQLAKHQETSHLGMVNFAKTFNVMELYEIKQVYACAESLAERGFFTDNLVLPVKLIKYPKISDLITQHDLVLNF